uniref:Reverse transcriptase domain-containing protein n=3 Tax=Kryptolebias marmoratus TaxID=37003 RepID=A0A3Q2ZSJ5_KRYMA
MTLPLTKTYMQTKRQIQFRSLKTIDLTLFNQDIQDISLTTKFTSVNDYVNHYNSSLRSILDTHAPVKTRTVTFSRSAPWFTSELRTMKTAGRALERQFISSGLLVHKQAYRKHQKTYSKALTAARSHYFSLKISNSRGNSKQLFSDINSLVKPSTYTHADTSIDHCNRFMDFFINKVASIQSALPVIAESQVDITLLMQSNTFSAFSVVTQSDVEKIVKSMKTSTCVLDPLPTALLKSNITAICPLITTIINQSLRASQVPPSLKTAVIHPYLKKPSLDPNILAHYRPVSNLPFISKVLEKVVAAQLHQHLHIHNFYEKFQSGFRSAHSTETALVRVMNDLLMTADQGSPSLLLLLDLSAAFDTVNHTILLNRLQSEIGLSGTALKWFHSYLTNRTEYVSLGQSKSSTHTVTCGVPQGSVLGPTLFTIYMLPLGHIINKHKVSFHCYADDTQLYMKMDSTSPTVLPSSLQLCLEEIKAWMTANSLQLNSNKTDVILLGTPHQTQSSNLSSISIFGLNIPFSTTVTNLGVRIDSNLTFNSHIRHLSKVSFLHLKNIARLRPSLSQPDAERLIHAFISSRLDYCNALLFGTSGKNLQKLQHIQNCAARVLMRRRKYDHITSVLNSLHWLPIKHRIHYKLCLLTYQCIHGAAPAYLSELLSLHATSRRLRSSTSFYCLHQPKTKLATMGDRAFQAVAPRLWNALPESLRAPQGVEAFKKGLKTHLFKQAF